MLPLVIAAIGLSQAPAGAPTIAGHVTDAITHRPIAGVRVAYCCTASEAETDATGAFLLHVEPSFPESRFTVTKAGYAILRQTIPAGPADHDFELMPSGHLSGRLLDSDSGEPLAGFQVVAIGRDSARGVFLAMPSDKDGSFTFNGEMAPGNYLVRAFLPKEYRFSAGIRNENVAAERGYGTTFFPGVASADAATPVAVSPGENRRIEIRLRAQERFSIAGTIEIPKGKESDGLRVRLTRNGEAVGNSEEKFRDGPFHIDGLASGSYLLTLLTRSGAAIRQSFQITDRSVDDLHIRLRDTVAIRATVRMREDKAPPPERATLRVMPADFAGPPSDPSDSLHIPDLPPGRYWPLLSVSSGYAVLPAAGMPVVLEAEEMTVEFAVTSRPATVTGVVRDLNQNPVANATVAISRDPTPARIDLLSGLRARSDANGVFRIADLAPGKYVISADNGEARKIELDFGQTASVDLQAPHPATYSTGAGPR